MGRKPKNKNRSENYGGARAGSGRKKRLDKPELHTITRDALFNLNELIPSAYSALKEIIESKEAPAKARVSAAAVVVNKMLPAEIVAQLMQAAEQSEEKLGFVEVEGYREEEI